MRAMRDSSRMVISLHMTTKNHLHLFLAILCGFALAFALLLSLTITVPLVGDILIGGVAMDREHPTVINAAMQNEEFRKGVLALGSFWFWTGVTIFGMFFS